MLTKVHSICKFNSEQNRFGKECVFVRLGESNIRHFEDSDLQILGFRCSEMEMSKHCKAVVCRNFSDFVPLDRGLFFPKQQFSLQHSSSIRSIWKGIEI